MRTMLLACPVVWFVLLAPASVLAQPAGSAAPSPAPGSAAATDPAPPPTEAPAPPATPATPATADAAALRKTCTDAMNADPKFAAKIVEIADADAAKKRLALDLAQHETAAKAVAKNQRHVVIAYAAMWIVAAAFVMFLWRRQQGLKTEIAQLRRELDAAAKDGT